MKDSNKDGNKYIQRRRRIIKIKKTILLSIILISVFITLCLKLPYFNVKNIYVNNNNNITSKEIIRLSQISNNSNIFYLNLRKVRSDILENPYILEATVERSIPSTLNIYVKERSAIFYSEKSNKFIIIDKDGIVLEEKDNVNNMNLIRLLGFDVSATKIGKVIVCDDERKIGAINKITELLSNSKVKMEISAVDISNFNDMKVYFKNMCIKIGNIDNLQEKLNKAINILNINNYKEQKGYIDVSFDGNPVVFIEK